MAVPISTHVFRFAGGFSITELLMPNGSALLSPVPAVPQPSPPAPKASSSVPGYTTVRGLFGGETHKRDAVFPTTLEQDMLRYGPSYRLTAASAAVALVFCGGNGAILGALTSVAFSGESGKERYVAVKRWINEHS